MVDKLSTWKDGPTKSAILDFVAQVTSADSPTFVPSTERIVTFDNDGTLWLEKPLYIQFQHILAVIGKAAAEHPELRDKQPFKAVYEKDMAWLGKVASDYANGDPSGIFLLVGTGAELTAGITPKAFEANALEFLGTDDSHFKMPYRELTYKPMIELVGYLQDNGFQVFITSGGGRDFMRAISEEVYGIPRNMVIGSSVTYETGMDEQGTTQVMRAKDIEQPVDDGPGKPVHIHRAIGRRPIMSAGNSNGDIEMLQYAKGHSGSTLALLIHHDDAEREYAYDAASEKALAMATDQDWIVVSMKNDWNTVF